MNKHTGFHFRRYIRRRFYFSRSSFLCRSAIMTQRQIKLNNSSRYLNGQYENQGETGDMFALAACDQLKKWQVARNQHYHKLLHTQETCDMCQSVTSTIIGRCNHCSLCVNCYVIYLKLLPNNFEIKCSTCKELVKFPSIRTLTNQLTLEQGIGNAK